jgi:hypothetical protein
METTNTGRQRSIGCFDLEHALALRVNRGIGTKRRIGTMGTSDGPKCTKIGWKAC